MYAIHQHIIFFCSFIITIVKTNTCVLFHMLSTEKNLKWYLVKSIVIRNLKQIINQKYIIYEITDSTIQANFVYRCSFQKG